MMGFTNIFVLYTEICLLLVLQPVIEQLRNQGETWMCLQLSSIHFAIFAIEIKMMEIIQKWHLTVHWKNVFTIIITIIIAVTIIII